MSTKCFTVEVTAEDIAQGDQGDCGRCPIARAVVRLPLKPGVYGRVGMTLVTFVEEGTMRAFARISLPMVAMQFIKSFDSHGASSVEPIAFPLDIPVEVLA